MPASLNTRRAPGLAAERGQVGVAGIERDPQGHRQRPFQGAGVEHRQVGEGGIADGLAQSRQQPRPREQLLGERTGGAVEGAYQHQPPARVLGRDPLQHAEVVVDDRLGQRLAGDIDEARSGHPQQQQHAQVALLVVKRAGDAGELLGIEAQCWHHHDGPRCRRVVEDVPEQDRQPLLQRGEATQFLGRAGLDLLVHLRSSLGLRIESRSAARRHRRDMP